MPRRIWVSALIMLALTTPIVKVLHAEQRPFRGPVAISVLLCKFSNSPAPPRDRTFFENMFIKPGTGGHADYWRDISGGSITLAGSEVKGWYTLDKTREQMIAYEGPNRLKKHSECVDKARASGYTPPPGNLVVVVTSPGIDTFGFNGGAFLGEDADVGIISHEVGHGMSLEHSYSDDSAACNAEWATAGEYDNQWDVMSYANVYSALLGEFGRAGPGLNAYHADRMGWLDRNRIFRFGADGSFDSTITLAAPNRGTATGYTLIRIPFDVNDLYRYYTVEYRVPETWDRGIGRDRVLISEVRKTPFVSCKTRMSSGTGAYRSYLVRSHEGNRDPLESLNQNQVRVDVISRNPATGQATVRVRSQAPDHCIPGLVWRETRSTDHVCVSPARRTSVRQENQTASSRRQPGGGAYGPDTCLPGFVWREAHTDDHVCVSGASRTLVRDENRMAFEKRIGGAAYGPNTCKSGLVWREADNRDWVCVTPQRRSAVRLENASGPANRQPGGGAYGPDTCRQGFVWRDAFPGDHVCVVPLTRTNAKTDNLQAHENLAEKGA